MTHQSDSVPPSSRPTVPPSAEDMQAIEDYERDVEQIGERAARLKWLERFVGVR